MPREATVLPASFTQQARYLRSDAGIARDNVAMAWRLEGDLDRRALDRAVGHVARRHESLRTSLTVLAGRPVQVIHPDVRPRLAFTDVLPLPPSRRGRAVARIATREGSRPFDLGQPFPLRLRLVRIGATSHVLFATATHAFWDAWTTDVFLRDVERCYLACRTGSKPAAAPSAIQFGDLAAAQWEWRDLEAEAYWVRNPLGAWPWISLPECDGCGPPELRQLRFSIAGPTLEARLRQTAAAAGTTRSIAVLSAFGDVIQQLSPGRRHVVAVVDANRDLAQTRDMMGCLATYAFVQLGTPGTGDVFGRLVRTHRQAVAARAHRLPLERLFPAPPALFGSGDEMASDELFDLIFNDLTQAAGAARDRAFGDVRIRPYALPPLPPQPSTAWWHRAKLALNVDAARRGGLEVVLEYRADRVPSELVEAVAGGLRRTIRDTALA